MNNLQPSRIINSTIFNGAPKARTARRNPGRIVSRLAAGVNPQYLSRVSHVLTWSQGVYVSLIGSNKVRMKELSMEVEKETEGRQVSEEEALQKRQRQSGSFGS